MLKISAPPSFRGINVIEKSNSATYFELPDTIDEDDPEKISTFRVKIKNPAIVKRFKEIISMLSRTYTSQKSKRCLPVYSSAIVFKIENETEIVLFSLQCSVLKLKEKNTYLDFDKFKPEIESMFREIIK